MVNIAPLRDIVVDVASPDQLFNAPPINPFSSGEVEVLGKSGLDIIVRQLQTHRRDWEGMRLLIRLPPDRITPELERRVTDAMRRFCRAKIEDNALAISQIRRRSSVGLGILITIVAILIAAAYALFTTVLSGAPQVVQFVAAGLISLFSWVTLWDALEALLFNPMPLRRENAALRKIIALDIAIEPDTAAIGAAEGGRSAAAH